MEDLPATAEGVKAVDESILSGADVVGEIGEDLFVHARVGG